MRKLTRWDNLAMEGVELSKLKPLRAQESFARRLVTVILHVNTVI